MLAGAALPFALRTIIERVGFFAPATRRGGRGRCWQHIMAALEDWWTTSYLAWRSKIPSDEYAERYPRFCRDCGEDTPHEGTDKFGGGRYAEIYRCQYCGGQGVRIWPLA